MPESQAQLDVLPPAGQPGAHVSSLTQLEPGHPITVCGRNAVVQRVDAPLVFYVFIGPRGERGSLFHRCFNSAPLAFSWRELLPGETLSESEKDLDVSARRVPMGGGLTNDSDEEEDDSVTLVQHIENQQLTLTDTDGDDSDDDRDVIIKECRGAQIILADNLCLNRVALLECRDVRVQANCIVRAGFHIRNSERVQVHVSHDPTMLLDNDIATSELAQPFLSDVTVAVQNSSECRLVAHHYVREDDEHLDMILAEDAAHAEENRNSDESDTSSDDDSDSDVDSDDEDTCVDISHTLRFAHPVPKSLRADEDADSDEEDGESKDRAHVLLQRRGLHFFIDGVDVTERARRRKRLALRPRDE